MKEVQTKNGPRWVQSLPASKSLWDVYKSEKPAYLSVRKDIKDGKTWWFAVWGETEAEVKQNLADLRQRENACQSGSSNFSRSRSSRGRRTGCSCGSIEGEYHDWYCESCRFDELDQ